MKRPIFAGLALAAVASTMVACAGGQATDASNVTRTSATLNGYWRSTLADTKVLVWFRYGKTTSYEFGDLSRFDLVGCSGYWFTPEGGVGATCSSGAANSTHAYSVSTVPTKEDGSEPYVYGGRQLSPGTTYHYTLCASDPENKPVCLGDKTFSTTP